MAKSIDCRCCATLILNPRPKQKFCSIKCGAAKRAEKGWATHICVRCGTEFKKHKNRKALYCKKSCLMAALHEQKQATKKPVVTVACSACSKEFETNCGKKFCSVKCAATTSAAQMGERNKNHKKTGPCATCGVEVTVARNVPAKKIHCDEHRSFHKQPKERSCLLCEKTFFALRPTSKWCSVKCASSVSAKERARESKEVPCRECGETVVVPRSSDGGRVLCPTHRREAKRAGNAKVAAEKYQKKCDDFALRLSFLLPKFGPESEEVNSFILSFTRYSKPMRKIADAALLGYADKLEYNRRTWQSVKQIKALIPMIAGTRAKRPYDYYLVTGLSWDEKEQTWVLSLSADVKGGQTKTVLLARYLMEAKVGRLLRSDEELTWISGIKRDCSLENLSLVTKITPIEYRGFWSKKEAS